MPPHRALQTERCLRTCRAMSRCRTGSSARSSRRTRADRRRSWRCCTNRSSTDTWSRRNRSTARQSTRRAHPIARCLRTSAATERCRRSGTETGCRRCRRPSHRPTGWRSMKRRSSTCQRARREWDLSTPRPTSCHRSGHWRHTCPRSTWSSLRCTRSQSGASCRRKSRLLEAVMEVVAAKVVSAETVAERAEVAEATEVAAVVRR